MYSFDDKKYAIFSVDEKGVFYKNRVIPYRIISYVEIKKVDKSLQVQFGIKDKTLPMILVINPASREKAEEMKQYFCAEKKKHENEPVTKEDYKTIPKSFVNFLVYCFIVLAVVAIVALVISLGNGGSSRTYGTKESCKSCGRSFSDIDNVKSIKHTGLCENCYENYEWGKDAIGK